MKSQDLPGEGLFEGVPWSAVRDLVQSAPVHDLPDGHLLVTPGEPLDKVWLVVAGQVGVFISNTDDAPIMTLGAGEPVGELAAIDGGPRSAWVVVQGTARVAEVTSVAFRALLERSHRVALNLLHLVAQRIRRSNLALEQRKDLLARTERAGLRDGLTGAFNRRWFDHRAPQVVAQAQGAGDPVSVVLIDIDHFKKINDTYGHPAGDAVLVEVSKQLRQRFRRNDEVARYGGEEFVVLLPGVGAEAAGRAAERVRQALALTGVPVDQGRVVRFTVSAGVAALQPDDSVSALISRADAALYLAKAQGRDRVVCPAPTAG